MHGKIGMHCVQLFTKEVVDRELNNDEESRLPVSYVPSNGLGNSNRQLKFVEPIQLGDR